jgi:hypothetical protein
LGIVLGSKPSHLLLISESFVPNALLICSVIQTVISQAAASPIGVPSGRRKNAFVERTCSATIADIRNGE